jgi:predicted transcriptional regulator of viral defense system
MAELSRLSFGPRNPDATVRVARLAERQWGVVTWAQLERCGVRGAAIVRAVRSGRLHRLYPGVYAVGHRALSVEGQLFAALAYAGPGAALSHGTAAWWWQLVREAPSVIHIIAAGRRRSITGVAVHHPRHVERTWHRQLPVTPVPRTLLDLASSVPVSDIRRALA